MTGTVRKKLVLNIKHAGPLLPRRDPGWPQLLCTHHALSPRLGRARWLLGEDSLRQNPVQTLRGRGRPTSSFLSFPPARRRSSPAGCSPAAYARSGWGKDEVLPCTCLFAGILSALAPQVAASLVAGSRAGNGQPHAWCCRGYCPLR